MIIHCSDGWGPDHPAERFPCSSSTPQQDLLEGVPGSDREGVVELQGTNSTIDRARGRRQAMTRTGPGLPSVIDCVWQVTQQFPNAFEFNEYFLTTILDHLYSCLFGTFSSITQTKSEESTRCPARRTPCGPFTIRERTCSSIIMYCSDLDSKLTLFPVASIPLHEVWKSYYCRWNLEDASPRTLFSPAARSAPHTSRPAADQGRYTQQGTRSQIKKEPATSLAPQETGNSMPLSSRFDSINI